MTAQDPELSAALGWPGGISDPVLDRTRLLQMVAALRLASKQALEALTAHADLLGTMYLKMDAITALRAALAQQAEPAQEPAFHGFMSDDGTQVDVCFSPSAPRRDGTYATAYYTAPPHRVAQQAEPVEPHRREGDNNIESPFNACMHKTYCMTLKQAEPVAGVVLNEEGRAALVEHGREEWHCVSRNARRLYTAPPQRTMVPLTEEEIDIIGITHQSLRQVVRAVERAHGIKE